MKEYDNMLLWYEKAAAKKYHIAYKKLCDYYKMINNYDKIGEYVTLESELNNDEIYNCGFECENNNDYDDMIYWYTLAANNNSINAIFRLCLYYEKCLNNKKYLFWIKKFNKNNSQILFDHYQKINDVKRIEFLKSIFNT
jgi:TPR repeat protein